MHVRIVIAMNGGASERPIRLRGTSGSGRGTSGPLRFRRGLPGLKGALPSIQRHSGLKCPPSDHDWTLSDYSCYLSGIKWALSDMEELPCIEWTGPPEIRWALSDLKWPAMHSIGALSHCSEPFGLAWTTQV